MDESAMLRGLIAMLRGLIDMILDNTCLNYEHKDLMIDDDSKILAIIKFIDEDSYSNCLAKRKEEYKKEIGEEKDGI